MTRAILLVYLVSGFFTSWAQNGVSLKLANAPFEQFVTEVERQTDVYFYYSREVTDTIQISISADNEALADLLQRVSIESGLKFTILRDAVFVTSRPIMSALPEDYFGQGTGSLRKFDYSDYVAPEEKSKKSQDKILSIGLPDNSNAPTATIAGSTTSAVSGEPLVGAIVVVEGTSIGTVTDANGFYSIQVPKGKHTLRFTLIGMKTAVRQLSVIGNGTLNIEMEEDVTPLKEVVIESNRDEALLNLKMGTEKLDIKTIKQMPSILGETDVLKVVLTLPGVQSVGEGASGVNIRGGSTNQNLILLNDAVVYNPSHLFGFFSAFNPDILKSVELYKSGINAEYGGRLSSVIDVSTREGNLKKFSASGGISPITGRLTLEGPLKKDRASFLFSVRSSYSDWLLRRVKSSDFQQSNASFYDLNLNLNHKINDKNSVQLSIYHSSDNFKLNSDTLYSYGESNGSLRWKHVINNKLYAVLTATHTDYGYAISSQETPSQAYEMKFKIAQSALKADLSYFMNQKNNITAGFQTTLFNLQPGRRVPTNAESLVNQKVLQNESGVESALYLGNNYEITSNLSCYAGLRYSFYQFLGPGRVYVYSPEVPRSTTSITDTLVFSTRTAIQNYHGPEPRVSLRYLIRTNTSIKLSYNRTRQYIHMLSNTTAIAPTDVWKLADRHINPQVGDQISIGFYQNLRGRTIELTAEAYYKKMNHALDYKDGAVLILNEHVETDAVNADGKAHGLELMLKKPSGKLNGWVSYTYSRTFLRSTGSDASESVNNGDYYPSNYDKPHAANFISNYKFNRRFNFSLNVTYSTGRPITIPLAKFEVNGIERTFYSQRNEFRIPDYFRADLSINIEGNHKIKKLAHSSWTLAVYNVTGRANAYSVYFVTEGQRVQGYKLSIFARPIPTITYNFKL